MRVGDIADALQEEGGVFNRLRPQRRWLVAGWDGVSGAAERRHQGCEGAGEGGGERGIARLDVPW